MDKQFPPIFRQLWRDPNVKQVWISDPPAGECANCGGSGIMITTLAHAGPFNFPPAIPAGSGMSDHWDGRKWWLTQSYTAPCPVCAVKKATGERSPDVPMPDYIRDRLGLLHNKTRIASDNMPEEVTDGLSNL